MNRRRKIEIEDEKVKDETIGIEVEIEDEKIANSVEF